jgi:hypothetical protein
VLTNTGHAIEHHFPQFVGNRLFGRMIEGPADSILMQYLRLYAVTHILVHDGAGRKIFDSLPDFKQVFSEEPYAIFEFTGAEKGRCFAGSADVAADYGMIRVQKAQTPRLVLKYHYYPTLKARPSSVTIGPLLILDDPVPFIQVKNGQCRDFEICR